MTELLISFRKDRPISCVCGAKFVPPDGPVLGVDDRHPDDIWPVVHCPACQETICCSPNHIATAAIR